MDEIPRLDDWEFIDHGHISIYNHSEDPTQIEVVDFEGKNMPYRYRVTLRTVTEHDYADIMTIYASENFDTWSEAEVTIREYGNRHDTIINTNSPQGRMEVT